jgi:cephalosporin-C deacetylase
MKHFSPNQGRGPAEDEVMRRLSGWRAALLMVLVAGGAAMAPAQEAADSKTTWHVDPALEGGRPVVRVEGTAATAVVWRVAPLRGDGAPLVEATVAPDGGAAALELPAVGEDTFVRVTAWEGAAEGEPAFQWVTLLRPAGRSLYEFAGGRTNPPPADFDEFWDRARAELDTVPPNPTERELEWGHTATGKLFEVELDTIGGTRIVARYTIPRAAWDEEGNVIRQFPAVIVMPGYGAEQPPMDRTPDGYITMSVNPRNHGPSRRFWTAPTEHLMYGIESPETYYYRLAFMDCLRAAQYLFDRPEVDPARVAAEGGSQGGLFSIALGALEPRIAVVVSNVTAFSSFDETTTLNLRGGGYNIGRRLAESTPEQAAAIRRTLSYVDGANMATRLRAPLQVNMGGQDPVCHFLQGIALLHRLRPDVPRQFTIINDAKHEVPGATREANARWVHQWIGDIGAPPRFPGRVLSPPKE